MHSITSPQKPPCSCYSASPWYNMALPSRRRFTSCARTLGALWMVKVIIFPCHGWAQSKLPWYIYYLNHHLGKRFEFFATRFRANSKCFYLEHFGILGGSTFKVMGRKLWNFPSVLCLGDFWLPWGDVSNFQKDFGKTLCDIFWRWRNSSSSFGIIFLVMPTSRIEVFHHCFSRVALFCWKPCQHILQRKLLKSQGSSIAITKSHWSYQLFGGLPDSSRRFSHWHEPFGHVDQNKMAHGIWNPHGKWFGFRIFRRTARWEMISGTSTLKAIHVEQRGESLVAFKCFKDVQTCCSVTALPEAV